MVVRKLKMLSVECVVRGYITGSGWKDYQATGAVSGIELPAGLRESERLPEPIFTPSTKADVGHDEAIDFEGAVELIGDRALAERARDVSIALYEYAAEHARAARDHPRRHEVRARPRRRRHADARRRGAARPTRRASGRPTATSPAAASRASTSSSSATGPRRRVGQEAAGAGDPRRRRRAHAREVRRGIRADHRRAVRRLAGTHRRRRCLMRARVLVKPKAGILDPQGQAVQRALPALGFTASATCTSGG